MINLVTHRPLHLWEDKLLSFCGEFHLVFLAVLSYSGGMAAPKTGRIFLRSHGDCFIHATAFFVKYWNFSLAQVSSVPLELFCIRWCISGLPLQEGLGIVQVTLVHPREHVFLACISPTPLPYEHVKKGMNHRRYLEMDPKFAAELGITHDTEVRCTVW